MSEQGDFAVNFDDIQEEDLAQNKKTDEFNQIKKRFREKHSKYMNYLNEEFQFNQDESVSLTLRFDLRHKKLLLLSLTEAAMGSVLVRNTKDIEKCNLITREGAEPYLFVQGINF
jgi:hypothetical protein